MQKPCQDLYTCAKVMLVDKHPHLHANACRRAPILTCHNWCWSSRLELGGLDTLEIHLQYHSLFISRITFLQARPFSWYSCASLQHAQLGVATDHIWIASFEYEIGRSKPVVCSTDGLEPLTTDAEAISPDLCEHIIGSILDALQLSLQGRQSMSALVEHQILQEAPKKMQQCMRQIKCSSICLSPSRGEHTLP